jgi:hypothetical protein
VPGRTLGRFLGCHPAGQVRSLLFGHVASQCRLAAQSRGDLGSITTLVGRLCAPIEFDGHPSQQRRSLRGVARRSAAAQ